MEKVAGAVGPVDILVNNSAATSGAIGFMRHLASENGPLGITDNTISQGLCIPHSVLIQHMAESIPVKRIGMPEDTGYLTSTEASYISGQTIGLNGGTRLSDLAPGQR